MDFGMYIFRGEWVIKTDNAYISRPKLNHAAQSGCIWKIFQHCSLSWKWDAFSWLWIEKCPFENGIFWHRLENDYLRQSFGNFLRLTCVQFLAKNRVKNFSLLLQLTWTVASRSTNAFKDGTIRATWELERARISSSSSSNHAYFELEPREWESGATLRFLFNNSKSWANRFSHLPLASARKSLSMLVVLRVFLT